MDLISAVVGAGLALGSAQLGSWRAAARLKTKRPKPIEAMCGCGHHLSKHDPQTNRCNDTVTKNGYDGGHSYMRHIACSCRQYVGPRPLDSFYSTPIATEEP